MKRSLPTFVRDASGYHIAITPLYSTVYLRLLAICTSQEVQVKNSFFLLQGEGSWSSRLSVSLATAHFTVVPLLETRLKLFVLKQISVLIENEN